MSRLEGGSLLVRGKRYLAKLLKADSDTSVNIGTTRDSRVTTTPDSERTLCQPRDQDSRRDIDSLGGFEDALWSDVALLVRPVRVDEGRKRCLRLAFEVVVTEDKVEGFALCHNQYNVQSCTVDACGHLQQRNSR